MNRFWSLIFLLIPVLGLAAFVFAIMGWWPLAGAWLPENFSETGNAIDGLFSIVHGVTAFFFIGFGVTIAWLIWKYSDDGETEALYFKSNLKLELLWSIIPAFILLFLAFYQSQTWDRMRVARPVVGAGESQELQPPLVRVIARQFAWEFHYAGRDNQHGTRDDYRVENLLVVPDDETIVLQLESRDVIHSFFVPKLRLKNDVVPGTIGYTWFKPLARAEMNILCAELCGWGHYKMIARLKIVSRAEFNRWDKQQQSRLDAPSLVPLAKSRPTP